MYNMYTTPPTQHVHNTTCTCCSRYNTTQNFWYIQNFGSPSAHLAIRVLTQPVVSYTPVTYSHPLVNLLTIMMRYFCCNHAMCGGIIMHTLEWKIFYVLSMSIRSTFTIDHSGVLSTKLMVPCKLFCGDIIL